VRSCLFPPKASEKTYRMAIVTADSLRTALVNFLNQSAPETISLHGDSEEFLIKESLMLKQGMYCGRKFTAQNHQLVWFIEENQIKLNDAQGQLLVSTSAALFVDQYRSTPPAVQHSKAEVQSQNDYRRAA
jgi:hypothetical protein